MLITPEGEWIADSEIILDRLEALHPEESIEPPDALHAFFVSLLLYLFVVADSSPVLDILGGVILGLSFGNQACGIDR